MKIDSHQHFWKYNSGEYQWINGKMAAIQDDFLPGDLSEITREEGIEGVISVQARHNINETCWLLELAEKHDFIKGVVGWVPLVSGGVEKDLMEFSRNPVMKAVRHVIHDEADDDFILGKDFNRGVAVLGKYNLAYDILILEKHLPQTIEFVDRHPGQVFILDHIAKPRIAENIFEPWKTNMRKLAERENVYCKISGLVTEADFSSWTKEQLYPYMETVLEEFGPERLMFGSDWPVCLVAACSYSRWLDIVRGFIAKLSDSEQERILGDTAAEAYKL